MQLKKWLFGKHFCVYLSYWNWIKMIGMIADMLWLFTL